MDLRAARIETPPTPARPSTGTASLRDREVGGRDHFSIYLTGVVASLAIVILIEALVLAAVVLLAFVLVGLVVGHRPTTRAVARPTAASSARPHDDAARDHVLIVSASIGAGHDGAAVELARQARKAGFVVDRVDFLDLLPPGLGRLVRSGYRWQITVIPGTWGLLLRSLRSPSDNHWIASLVGALARKRLMNTCQPSTRVIVSTYPLASQALSQLRRDGSLAIPAITYLTDMSVHPLWVASDIDAHVALHAVPAAEAASLGARGVEVLGPQTSPCFAPTTPALRDETRKQFDLPRDQRLALVVAGSWGVGDVTSTVEDVLATGVATPVVVCGSNPALRRTLQSRGGVHTFGWVDDMAALMRACDLVIQNAGGLTSLEARAAGLPVITYRALPGHGENQCCRPGAGGLGDVGSRTRRPGPLHRGGRQSRAERGNRTRIPVGTARRADGCPRVMASPGGALLAAASALYLAPTVTALAPVRRLSGLDSLSGVGSSSRVALTFDDGPDIESTPYFIRLLEELDVRATFFVLGRMVQRHPAVARDLVNAGHEIGIHGWDHRPLPLRGPVATLNDISRATELVREVCGVEPQFYRPPYGVLSWSALGSAHRLGLSPVLWTTWGRDWRSRADVDSVENDVLRHLGPGGTILLHDSDCTSASGSWRATLGAVPQIISAIRNAGLEPGPLREHDIVSRA